MVFYSGMKKGRSSVAGAKMRRNYGGMNTYKSGGNIHGSHQGIE
jgi:hypothetical protein